MAVTFTLTGFIEGIEPEFVKEKIKKCKSSKEREEMLKQLVKDINNGKEEPISPTN